MSEEIDPGRGDDFFIYLLTAPFDTVLPWFGGFVGHLGVLADPVLRAQARQVDHPRGTVVPRMPESGGWATYRLIDVYAGAPFCIFEVNTPGEADANTRSIHHFVQCRHVEFENSMHGNKLWSRAVTVRDRRELTRLVAIERPDTYNPNTTGRLVFWTKGTPEPWEHVEKYQSKRVLDRLSLDLMADYMAAFGLDFETWKSRKFHRVTDFRPRGDEGTPLDQYKAKASLFEALDDEDIAKLQQGILPCS